MAADYRTRLMPANAVIQQKFKESGAVQEQVPGREREEKIVKRNQNKVEPVSKWHCPRQASSFKVHRRVVWSFIFLLFGVYQAKAEVQVDQTHKEIAREAYQDLQDGNPWMKERMAIWEDWCLKQKERKTARERTQEPLKETVREGTPVPKKVTVRARTQGPWKKVVKVGTSALAKQTARERIREPQKHQLKGGGSRKSGKKRSGKGRRKREKCEAQKKSVVDKAQRTICELPCVGKERRRFGEKRQREE